MKSKFSIFPAIICFLALTQITPVNAIKGFSSTARSFQEPSRDDLQKDKRSSQKSIANFFKPKKKEKQKAPQNADEQPKKKGFFGSLFKSGNAKKSSFKIPIELGIMGSGPRKKEIIGKLQESLSSYKQTMPAKENPKTPEKQASPPQKPPVKSAEKLRKENEEQLAKELANLRSSQKPEEVIKRQVESFNYLLATRKGYDDFTQKLLDLQDEINRQYPQEELQKNKALRETYESVIVTLRNLRSISTLTQEGLPNRYGVYINRKNVEENEQKALEKFVQENIRGKTLEELQALKRNMNITLLRNTPVTFNTSARKQYEDAIYREIDEEEKKINKIIDLVNYMQKNQKSINLRSGLRDEYINILNKLKGLTGENIKEIKEYFDDLGMKFDIAKKDQYIATFENNLNNINSTIKQNQEDVNFSILNIHELDSTSNAITKEQLAQAQQWARKIEDDFNLLKDNNYKIINDLYTKAEEQDLLNERTEEINNKMARLEWQLNRTDIGSTHRLSIKNNYIQLKNEFDNATAEYKKQLESADREFAALAKNDYKEVDDAYEKVRDSNPSNRFNNRTYSEMLEIKRKLEYGNLTNSEKLYLQEEYIARAQYFKEKAKQLDKETTDKSENKKVSKETLEAKESVETAMKALFRRGGLKLHPDKNPGDKNAEEAFKAINNLNSLVNNSIEKMDVRLQNNPEYENQLAIIRKYEDRLPEGLIEKLEAAVTKYDNSL